MALQLIHVLYLVSGTSQIYWMACIIIWLHNFRCWQAICQRLLSLWMWLWLVIVALYYVAATENLLSTLQFAELARDWLHNTGKYAVEGGIISPVHDAYGKKVHGQYYVKTAYMCYVATPRSASCSHFLDRNFQFTWHCTCANFIIILRRPNKAAASGFKIDLHLVEQTAVK